MEGEELKKVLTIRVASLNDLVRLAVTYATPSQTVFLLKFYEKNRLVIGLLGLFRDYYKYYGLPILYYHVCSSDEKEKIINANYIIVSTSDGERIEFTKYPRPGISIPLITLTKKPPIIPELE